MDIREFPPIASVTGRGEEPVRTTVSLDAVSALLEGRLGRPMDVLGPQTVCHEGRKMLAVRAFLPQARQVWVVDPAQGVGRPMRRLHPAGLYEAL
jgi:1,4-alpha-glucan branching enzyme